MLSAYLPIVIFFVLIVALAALILLLSSLLGPRNRSKIKLLPCENAGTSPGRPVLQFSSRLFTLAALFLTFEAMIIFLIPWAAVVRRLGSAGLPAMVLSGVLLFVGFLFAWKKGVQEWD